METRCLPVSRVVRTTAPTFEQEPITLAEARKQCEIADAVSYHDQTLARLITAARETVENDTGIVCYTGEHKYKFTDWPSKEWFEIPARPVTAVTSITYVDGSGTTQTWSASDYTLDTFTVMPTVRLAYTATWPAIRGDINGITVTFTAGYASVLAIPRQVKLASLYLINHWFVSRDTVSIGTISPEISETYAALISRMPRPTYP